MDHPYVITGAGGRTGSAAARFLLETGAPVRVVLRDPAKAAEWVRLGAEVAIADLTNPAAMSGAFANAQGAYVVSPQEYERDDLFERADVIAGAIAQAAVAACVPKLVALSSVGAGRDGGTGWIGMNRTLEQHLVGTGIPIAFVRAAYFMENWLPMIQQAVATGTLSSFLLPVERALPMIATREVGRVSAMILQEDWSGRRIIDLEGPKAYAPVEVAAALADLMGHSVEAIALPEADWPDALSEAGFSASALGGFVEMTQGLNSGHLAFEPDVATEQRRGTLSLPDVVASVVRSATV